MKASEFNALCRREHEQDEGVVTELNLTPESHVELTCDVLGDPAGLQPNVPGSAPGGIRAAGAKVGEMVNPATRTPVLIRTITLDGFTDTAEVRRWVKVPAAS